MLKLKEHRRKFSVAWDRFVPDLGSTLIGSSVYGEPIVHCGSTSDKRLYIVGERGTIYINSIAIYSISSEFTQITKDELVEILL